MCSDSPNRRLSMWVLMPGMARRLARSVRFRFSFLKIRSSVSLRPTMMSIAAASALGGGPGGAAEFGVEPVAAGAPAAPRADWVADVAVLAEAVVVPDPTAPADAGL